MDRTTKYILAMDIGTSAVKVSLYKINNQIENLVSCTAKYGLYSAKPDYAEQDPEEIWNAICEATKFVAQKAGVNNNEIACVNICSQAQSVILVDQNTNALRMAINCQDCRAQHQYEKGFTKGFSVAGLNLRKVLKCMKYTGIAPASAKDPLWKLKWVQESEPEIYAKAYKCMDMKDFIIAKLTGKFITTPDNAHAYCLYDTRPGHLGWNTELCKMFGIDSDLLPEIVSSDSIVGGITKEAANLCGLNEGTVVLGGLIDVSGIQIGSGAVCEGQTQIYCGSSGWVSTPTTRRKGDADIHAAGLVSAVPGLYNYYAVLESAGISFDWVKNHVVSDDSVLMQETFSTAEADVLHNMAVAAEGVGAGSDGLIFTPWISGTRCPFEASDVGGMFINMKLGMGKKHIIRAVLEGICYHFKWILDCEQTKVNISDVIRFTGGGAKSDVTAQILADVTGHIIEVPYEPQDVGTYGTALLGYMAMSDKKIDLPNISSLIKIEKTFYPNKENSAVYNEYYELYKYMFKKNKKVLAKLNNIKLY